MAWTHKQGVALAAMVLALTVGLTAMVVAQGRVVVVNGALLDDAGLAQLDQINCGTPVPDGNYWIDGERGVWGYVGQFGEAALPNCSAGQTQPGSEQGDCESQYTLHEDRMCYCYGVC